METYYSLVKALSSESSSKYSCLVPFPFSGSHGKVCFAGRLGNSVSVHLKFRHVPLTERLRVPPFGEEMRRLFPKNMVVDIKTS